MLKISFIGAGSIVFAKKVIKDILSFKKLREHTLISLEDIDTHRLDLMHKYMQKYKEDNAKLLENVEIESTTKQEKSIADAKYIISAIQVGGLEAYKLDMDIPLKYGVTQCVGDTLGPGGIFRGLRTMHVFKSIIKDIQDVGYQGNGLMQKPLFLNYTNPMAMNCWYCNEIAPGLTVGLCHGVQGTSNQMKMYIGTGVDEYYFKVAGINHMSWFLEAWFKDSFDDNAEWVDAYPLIWEHYKDEPKLVGSEKVRWDMMKATGYYMTESSGHLSEYLPYYRKREDLLEKYRGSGTGFDSLKHATYYNSNIEKAGKLDDEFERELNMENMRFKKNPSEEYGSHIINAIEANKIFRFVANIENRKQAFITNLPEDCTVEVSTFVDAYGLHPEGGIELPTQCQALCISNIMVQKAAVEGFLESSREKIYHAILLDPNTASVLSPEEIREMTDEMFQAQSKWLPKFQ